MTVGDWLRTRTPAAPDQLLARVEEILGPRCGADGAQAADVCLAAATELLTDLLDRPSAGRESALDLLTVDALVTYAFEAAAESPDDLADRTTIAMQSLAATARV